MDEFDRDKSYSSGYKAHCSECRKVKAAKSRATNKERNSANKLQVKSKNCCKCKQDKPGKEFPISNHRGDGLFHKCRDCTAETSAVAREKIRQDRNLGLLSISQQHTCTRCKTAKGADMFYRDTGYVKGLSCYCKDCERILKSARHKERIKTDEQYKLLRNIRWRIKSALQRQLTVKHTRSIDLLGCSMSVFVEYLEKLFLPGMSWENYGSSTDRSKVWVIDHDLPCAMFCMLSPAEQKRCFHFTNQQPMWAEDNSRKRDVVSIEDDILSSMYRLFDENLDMW